MPSSVPTPVAAALGIVPTVLSGVRAIPQRAVQLPVLAVSSALTALDGFRREYDDLAERGERLIARLRGTSLDELEDTVEHALAGTPLAGPYDAVENAVEAALDRASGAARTAGKGMERATDAVEHAADAVVTDLAGATRAGERAARKATAPATTARSAKAPAKAPSGAGASAATTIGKDVSPPITRSETAPVTGTPIVATAPASAVSDPAPITGVTTPAGAADGDGKGAATPKETPTGLAHPDTAATPAVVGVVEQAVQEAASGADQPVTAGALPLPDYDHMTLGSLRGRLRSLEVDQLIVLRTYEKAHADRLPVVTMLDNRIAKLATDAAASPTTGGPSA